MSRVPSPDPLLGFVLDFCNTYDLLNDPPDRLSLELLRRLADKYGLDVRIADLDRARTLRNRLYDVFAASSVDAKATVLNGLLAEYEAAARLVPGPRLAATGGRDSFSRLAIACTDTLARTLAEGAADRLRTCAGDPCRCVYVDRTKANRQRYCCELCNDRMASAAYRQRKR